MPTFSDCTKLDNEHIAYFLRILSNEDCLSVLKCIKRDKLVSRDEIIEATKMEFDYVTRILHGFSKRKIIKCTFDSGGKHGYNFGKGFYGLHLILAGCSELFAEYLKE